jgi:hypothetical protein
MSVQSYFVFRIEDVGEREVSERVPISQETEVITKFFDVRLFRLIDQNIARINRCSVAMHR